MRRRGVLVFLAGAVVVGGAGPLAVPGAAGAWAAPTGAAASWGRAVPVPGLADLGKSGSAQVLSVSCASPGSCAAGGYYGDGSDHQQGFVASQRHGRWGKAIEMPGLAALNKGGDADVFRCRVARRATAWPAGTTSTAATTTRSSWPSSGTAAGARP